MKQTIRLLAILALSALWAAPLGAQPPVTQAPGAAPAAAAKDTAGTPPKEDTGAMNLKPRVKMSTTLGDIVIELDGEKAPASVLNFLRYVDEGFYAGTAFHRVMSTFMIQGGGYTANLDEKKTGLHEGVTNEWQNGLKNVKGSIAMARLGGQPDSARAQFFINVVNNPALDTPNDGAAYAVFGKVVEGLDVVEKIRNTPVENNPKYPGGKVVPVTPVEIKEAKVVGKADTDAIKKNLSKVVSVEDFIAKYEADNKVKFQKTASGLQYAVVREGTGASPKPTDKVEVNYLGTFLDGKEFDSSYKRGQSTSFLLNQVIGGWTEGVGLMKVGGKAALICPGNLAYGPQGRPGIPPNATLFFEVELLAIK
jgi:FKBP-type peptidyl-prolyl cis-trans isomerase